MADITDWKLYIKLGHGNNISIIQPMVAITGHSLVGASYRQFLCVCEPSQCNMHNSQMSKRSRKEA